MWPRDFMWRGKILIWTHLIKNGGLEKMWLLFREKTDKIINELNEALAA